MIYTSSGARYTTEWIPVAVIEGWEWALTQRRYEQLYRKPRLCRVLYGLGWLAGKITLACRRMARP